MNDFLAFTMTFIEVFSHAEPMGCRIEEQPKKFFFDFDPPNKVAHPNVQCS